MKSNLIKYALIMFFIGIMICAIFIIKNTGDKKEKKVEIQEKIQTEEKEINLGIITEDKFNPILSKNKTTQNIQKLIFEPLIDLDKDYKLTPGLASEWSKLSNKIYLIKIKDNIKWSDGNEITANDVKFTIDLIKNSDSIYSNQVNTISNVEIIDSKTIRILLNKEVPFFEYNLTFPIIPENNYLDEDVFIGTGKYKINNNTDGYIELDKNENWWGLESNTQLKLEKITVKKYNTFYDLYSAFEKSEIDFISSDSLSFNNLVSNIGYDKTEAKGQEHTFLALNTNKDILNSQEVRKAISNAIDKNKLIDDIGEKYIESNFPLDFQTWMFTSSSNQHEYNPEQSKEILTNEKLNIDLLVNEDSETEHKVADNIKEQLAFVGVNINIISKENDEYLNILENKQFDIALCKVYLSINPNMDWFFGDNNISNYNNKKIFELMLVAKNTTNEEEISKSFKSMSDIYNNECPYISLYSTKYIGISNSKLTGEMYPNWYNSYYGIETWLKY